MGFQHIDAGIFAPVTSTEKLVLLVVAYHCNDNDLRCFPSFGRIARITGLSERGVSKALKNLESKGVLSLVRGTGTTSSTYRLPFLKNPYPDPDKVGAERGSPLNVVRPSPEPDSPRGMNDVQEGAERGSPKQEVNRNSEKEDNMNLFPAPLSADDGGEQGKASIPPKPKKEKKASDADPRHHEITSQWSGPYKTFHGQGYVFSGKDVSVLKRFLASARDVTAAQFMERAGKAWAHAKADRFARQCARAATIAGLCDAWNDIVTEMQRPAAGTATMHDRRPKNRRDERGQLPGEIPTDVTAAKIPRIG